MEVNVEQIDTIIDVALDELFGVGIAKLEQTVQSDEPGGINIWTATLTNGRTSMFTVTNGYATDEQVLASISNWMIAHSGTPMTVAYVKEDTLFIETNVVDGNEVEF